MNTYPPPLAVPVPQDPRVDRLLERMKRIEEKVSHIDDILEGWTRFFLLCVFIRYVLIH